MQNSTGGFYSKALSPRAIKRASACHVQVEEPLSFAPEERGMMDNWAQFWLVKNTLAQLYNSWIFSFCDEEIMNSFVRTKARGHFGD